MATHQEMIAIDIVIAAHYLFYLFTHYKRMNTSIKCEEMIATDIVISFVTHYTRTSIKCKIIAFTWYDHMERPLPPPNSEYTNQNSKFLCSTDRWVLYATVRLYIPAGKRLLLG